MSLVDRAKGILLDPKKEWAAIEHESTSVGSIFTSYVIPLALIPPVCWLIGVAIIGYGSVLGMSIKYPIGEAIKPAVVMFIMLLVCVYVLGLAIDALAPNFGGTKNPLAAFKVAAYSATPVFVAGILYLLPSLGGWVFIGAIYAAFLLFLGLPMLMKSAEDKTPIYAIVAIVCMVVLGALAQAVQRQVVGFNPMNPMGG